MPQRPPSHVVGDQAASAVAQLFTDIGCACERVTQDYGEDLHIQTALEGRMDPSRIWVQVKGTTNLERFKRKAGYSRTFPFHQVERWVRSADLVVVAIWDVERDYGIWALPNEQVGAWDPSALTSEQSGGTIEWRQR